MTARCQLCLIDRLDVTISRRREVVSSRTPTSGTLKRQLEAITVFLTLPFFITVLIPFSILAFELYAWLVPITR